MSFICRFLLTNIAVFHTTLPDSMYALNSVTSLHDYVNHSDDKMSSII